MELAISLQRKKQIQLAVHKEGWQYGVEMDYSLYSYAASMAESTAE